MSIPAIRFKCTFILEIDLHGAETSPGQRRCYETSAARGSPSFIRKNSFSSVVIPFVKFFLFLEYRKWY